MHTLAPLAVLCALAACALTDATGTLVFEDTFDGPLNTTKWNVENGPHLHGYNSAANAFTANGSLVLRTVALNQTFHGVKYFVASSAVDTSLSLVQEYGAWEARIPPGAERRVVFKLPPALVHVAHQLAAVGRG